MTTAPPTLLRKNVDSFQRRINYLRISVTDRCNLRCRYCVPKDTLPLLDHGDIARYEELLRITRLAAELGITKVRITGGEPLVRRGIVYFIEKLSKIPGIEDIAMTTNGVLLKPRLPELMDAGLKRLNISLDTLKPETFHQITGRDLFPKVWEGIMAALDSGFSPIKLNTVPLKGINDDEIVDLAGLAVKYPLHVRFIEYMPMGNSAVDDSQRILAPEIQRAIETKLGRLTPVPSELHDGPASRFTIKDAPGEIGLITPVSSHFCHKCNRLRLTSQGHLRACLLDDKETDILAALRDGASDKKLMGIIHTTILSKPLSHHLNQCEAIHRVPSQMSSIGG